MGKAHKQELYCYLEPGSVIVDPWRSFDRKQNEFKVVHYGDTRK